MHKAIFQCKPGKLLGMFGNMTRSIMGKMLTGRDWQPKYHTVEVSREMFTANMQSFILNIIHIGSQVMHIYNYWIPTT